MQAIPVEEKVGIRMIRIVFPFTMKRKISLLEIVECAKEG